MRSTSPARRAASAHLKVVSNVLRSGRNAMCTKYPGDRPFGPRHVFKKQKMPKGNNVQNGGQRRHFPCLAIHCFWHYAIFAEHGVGRVWASCMVHTMPLLHRFGCRPGAVLKLFRMCTPSFCATSENEFPINSLFNHQIRIQTDGRDMASRNFIRNTLAAA